LEIVRGCLDGAFAVEHGQWAEAARLVDVGAIAILGTFGDQAFTLPEKLCGLTIDGLLNATTKGVVLVACGAATGQRDANQAMLAVVAVFGDQLLSGTTAFATKVAVGVVVVMPVALHKQAITFDVGEVRSWQIALAEQVAGRVMSEGFGGGAANADQTIQWIIVVAAVSFAAVIDAGQVAVCIVGVAAQEQIAILLTYGVRLKPSLFVVLILAEQHALLALLFTASVELVRSQARPVEVDAAQPTAGQVAVIECAAIRQAAVIELADAVVFVTRGAPALMLGDQSILHIIFISKRPMTIVHIDQTAKCIVAVVNFLAVGQGFDQQATRGIALILGHQFTAVVTKLGFLQQFAVEVVLVSGTTPVETGFLLDQPI